MRIVCERFGRPYNYLKSVNHLNEQREKYLLDEEENLNHGCKNKADHDKTAKEETEKALEKLFEERLMHVKTHMTELNACEDLNLRQFLMKYIIPVLTEGMIDVWKVGPVDPVDYLAEYIFKRSNGA